MSENVSAIHHGRLSGSRVPQYLNCSAAPAISDRAKKAKYPGDNDDDEFNVLGTAAHALAEHCFNTNTSPADHIGKCISAAGDVGDDGIAVDSEMAEAVDHYVGYVSRLAASPFTSAVFIEGTLTSRIHDEATGVVDAAIISGTELNVIDYKHGAGVKVVAKRNDQLAFYALLILEQLDGVKIDRIVLTIIQPRYFGNLNPGESVVDTWATTPEYLIEFRQRIIDAVENVEAADVREMTDGLTADDTNPGDHCQWCRGKALCPGVYKQTVVTLFGESMPAADFAAPSELTPAHLEYILGLEDSAKAFFKSVRSFVFKELQRGNGNDYPGYKLVEKKGNRRYIDSEAALKTLGRKYGVRKVTTSVLMSPAQVEKAIGKEAKPLIAKLTERPITGQTLTQVSNARPAIEFSTADQDFAPIDGAQVVEGKVNSVEDLF